MRAAEARRAVVASYTKSEEWKIGNVYEKFVLRAWLCSNGLREALDLNETMGKQGTL